MLTRNAFRFLRSKIPATRMLTTASARCLSHSPKALCYPSDYETFQIATVRKEAPIFTAKGVVEGKIAPKPFTLTDFRGKYVVLLFYPLDFTFVCPTEIVAYNKRRKEFEDINTQVLTMSVDSVYSHAAWSSKPKQQGGISDDPIKIPMLSDITKEISKDYGVLIENEGIALRGQFIIDKSGILRHSSVNDLQIGRNVDETLRILHAVQYSDTHKGSVMPCGWKPGQDVITP
uniref:Thioredoxin domain-containing protein n=1 Tax=Paramoeba aestuarina TaxID=180227 RepID=A0A7S4V111_9EUKA|mmetsp:Transcript_9793/g.14817  ORF Transcript_9793/g.14817 Transcript_9793/m.14817 type:complete len:232 (+) Transcript_9793:24-719(+)